jgi:hypothetical protein
MRGVPPPHPSRRAHARSSLRNPTRTRAPQDEDGRARGSSLNRSRYFHLTMSNSPSHSRDAFLRPGFFNFASPTRIEGWAQRRETFGCSAEHPLGLHMTRQARRLRGALRPMTRQLPSRAASSSHPGRSAWRAGSLPPGANGYEPPPQDATPRSAFRIVSRTRPQRARLHPV